MSFSILSTALHVPTQRYFTEDMLKAVAPHISEDLADVLRGIGVQSRFSVAKDLPHYVLGSAEFERTETVTGMGISALQKAIESALSNNTMKNPKHEIGFLITITNTQGRVVPGLVNEIQATLTNELSRDIEMANLQGQGCSCLLKAFSMASWYLNANPDKKVAITLSEVHSAYFHPLKSFTFEKLYSFRENKSLFINSNDYQQRVIATQGLLECFLFGDGAAALILGKEGGKIKIGKAVHRTNTEPNDVELLTMEKGGSNLAREPGIPMYMMSEKVPSRGAAYAKSVVETLMLDANFKDYSLQDFTQHHIHTGSMKILNGVCDQLKISSDSKTVSGSFEVLKKYGNLSSPSLAAMIHEHIKPGKGIMVGFGVGFSASACPIECTS